MGKSALLQPQIQLERLFYLGSCHVEWDMHLMSWLREEKKRENVNKYISHLSRALKAHSEIILKNSFGEKIKDQFKHLQRDEDSSHWNNIASHRQTLSQEMKFTGINRAPTSWQNHKMMLLKWQLKWELVFHPLQSLSSSTLIRTFIKGMKH